MSTTQNHTRKRWPVIVGIIAVLIAIAVAFTFVFPIGSLLGNKNEAAADASVRVATPTESVVDYLISEGWTTDQFTTDLTVEDGDEVFEAGAASFDTKPNFTTEQLDKSLKSDSAKSKLRSAHVKKALKGKDVVWVGIKFKVAIQIEGNLGTDGKEIIDYGTRNSGAGEIIFFPVDKESLQVVEGIIIRAGCGNPGTRVIPPCETTGTCNPCVEQGNCKPVCPYNPNLPENSPKCLEPKRHSNDVDSPHGWNPQPHGPKTTGNESEQQKEDGDTSGNVTDNKVPSGTKTGDTTTEVQPTPKPSGGGGGGSSSGGGGNPTPGGDDRTDDTSDDHTNDDTGTNGNTGIGGPPAD